jgi:hypothetical protein
VLLLLLLPQPLPPCLLLVVLVLPQPLRPCLPQQLLRQVWLLEQVLLLLPLLLLPAQLLVPPSLQHQQQSPRLLQRYAPWMLALLLALSLLLPALPLTPLLLLAL